MYKSQLSQKLLNYFDEKDNRIRQHPYSLDQQLMNTAAIEIDDFTLRFNRELNSTKLSNNPTNIDNFGVYNKIALDNNLVINEDTDTLNSVIGIKNGVQSSITKYDDRFRQPEYIEIDNDRKITKSTENILCSVIGIENGGLSTPIHRNINTTLEIPDRITFYLNNTNSNLLSINIEIVGKTYPEDLWNQSLNYDKELIKISTEGIIKSKFPWKYINQINIFGLTQDSNLIVYKNPINTPLLKDEVKYYHHKFRGSEFDKYFGIDKSNNILNSYYYLDNFTAEVPYETYNLPSVINDICLEPNTNGALAISNNTLYFFDRREPYPNNISKTALKVEPLYGVLVYRNYIKQSSVTWIDINPVPYSKSTNISTFRYCITFPDNTKYILLNDGSLITYNDFSNWSPGTPFKLTLPLSQNGSYLIELQCYDTSGNLSIDAFPFGNFQLSDLNVSTYNLTNIISEAKGIFYDHLNQLWLFDGNFYIPIKMIYNGYILDSINRKIYLTDTWEQVIYD